jgi:predicted nucleic acid-binding protein
MRLVLDASVAIASSRPKEPSFRAARARVVRAIQGDDELVVPAIFGAEIAGVLVRLQEREDKIRALIESMTTAPHEVVPIRTVGARQLVNIAIAAKTRGADTTYIWLAKRQKLPLCTLDKEMADAARALEIRVIAP